MVSHLRLCSKLVEDVHLHAEEDELLPDLPRTGVNGHGLQTRIAELSMRVALRRVGAEMTGLDDTTSEGPYLRYCLLNEVKAGIYFLPCDCVRGAVCGGTVSALIP